MPTHYSARTAKTGGATGALDAMDGASLVDGDLAPVIENGAVSFHHLDAASGAEESSPEVIAPNTNAGNKRWTLCEMLVADAAGDFSAVNRRTGDSRYAPAALNQTPASDDTYEGITMQGVAGEALAQWDLVYSKNVSGTLKWFKYDANGADKAKPPRAMAVAAISAGSTGTLLRLGVVRNDGWAMTTNQDEGKLVYASATPGAITLTAPATSGDIVIVVGEVLEENVIFFNPSRTYLEVA